ncbi:hypothetical protein D5R40_30940 [Okeania hirsuta]|uniref:Uncharacterized protein n=1 Tax=Okeania hirsuta TaxID=1458930 RepID=A0A3N6NVS9_9CYAN|nr:hypothetical protein D5R40_30940 [Okeania hirsuta]
MKRVGRKEEPVGTMIFSGPLQPAQWGATIASLKLHMGHDSQSFRQKLRNRIAYFQPSKLRSWHPSFFESISPFALSM